MHRNQSVSTHKFAMIPKQEIPRSSFRQQHTRKMTFDSGWLVPCYAQEVLPGDTFSLNMTAFARMATPLFPVMDNLHLETFWFFVPNRLVWDNWVKFMGEQENPGDSISYLIPQTSSAVGGYPVGSLQDHFALPTVGQVDPTGTVVNNSLILRGYNLIYNQWFRDENLQSSATVSKGNGPENYVTFLMRKRGKRHDYFTSALPWTQKGATPVTVPLGTSAPVKRFLGSTQWFARNAGTDVLASTNDLTIAAGGGLLGGGTGVSLDPNGQLYADLSASTGATINQLRFAFQVQALLEKDARGGTRYTEMVFQHFGVQSPDGRLQRPEFLGGGHTMISINPVAQTSATTGTDTPQGNLSAYGSGVARNGFSQSFTEHGHIIGIMNVRADLTYQQGMNKMWSRQTRYDYYFPVFANLGEQAILNKEIYYQGLPIDDSVFGYIPRWDEYRHKPSEITGLMKSTSANTIDAWHLAQRFTALPTLNTTFMEENPPLERILAVGSDAAGQQFLCDIFFDVKATRPLPMYSIPAMMNRF